MQNQRSPGQSRRLKRVIIGASLAATLCSAIAPSYAQPSSCGSAPVVEDRKVQAEIDSRASFLTRFFGRAALSGKINQERSDIFSKYAQSDQARANAYFQFVLCNLLLADPDMSKRERAEAWAQIGRSFPESKERKPDTIPNSNVRQGITGDCGANFNQINGTANFNCSR